MWGSVYLRSSTPVFSKSQLVTGCQRDNLSYRFLLCWSRASFCAAPDGSLQGRYVILNSVGAPANQWLASAGSRHATEIEATQATTADNDECREHDGPYSKGKPRHDLRSVHS